MTIEEMQDMIDNCKRWIALIEKEIERVSDGWVSHPVGDTSVPGTITTNADRLRYLGPDGKLHVLGER